MARHYLNEILSAIVLLTVLFANENYYQEDGNNVESASLKYSYCQNFNRAHCGLFGCSSFSWIYVGRSRFACCPPGDVASVYWRVTEEIRCWVWKYVANRSGFTIIYIDKFEVRKILILQFSLFDKGINKYEQILITIHMYK